MIFTSILRRSVIYGTTATPNPFETKPAITMSSSISYAIWGLHLYFLKQIVNNTSQTGGLRKINLGDKEPVPSDLLIRVRKADDFSERSQQDLV